MWTIMLPDGSMLQQMWDTAEAAGAYLASAEHLRSGEVVEVIEDDQE